MRLSVQRAAEGHRLAGDGNDVELANRFLAHLAVRNDADTSCCGNAYDLLNFLRFLGGRGLRVVEGAPTDAFGYLDWQARRRRSGSGSTVVRVADWRGDAPATMNRRVAAIRGMFEYAVTTGARAGNPVPAARRTSSLRVRRGQLGHLPARNDRGGAPGARCVNRGDCPTASLWPTWSLPGRPGHLPRPGDGAGDAARRAAGCWPRAAEARVAGKGGRERVVPVNRPFFAELAPPTCARAAGRVCDAGVLWDVWRRPAPAIALFWIGLSWFAAVYSSSSVVISDSWALRQGRRHLQPVDWLIAIAADFVLGAVTGAAWEDRRRTSSYRKR